MYSLNKDLKKPTFPVGIFTNSNFLSDKEITSIFYSINHSHLHDGKVSGEQNKPDFIKYENEPNQLKDKTRKSVISWLHYNKTNIPLKNIFKKIFNEIIEVNNERFGFNLTDVEPLQFTTYSVGEYYNKHMDLGEELHVGNVQRKLSFSIQLSDPSEYEGGELCCYLNAYPMIADKQKGSISFFPSFLLHEVTPVTKGKRVSLVGWVNGPRFQ